MNEGKMRLISTKKVSGTARKDRNSLAAALYYNTVNITVPFIGIFDIFRTAKPNEFELRPTKQNTEQKDRYFDTRKVSVSGQNQKMINARGMFTPGDYIAILYDESEDCWIMRLVAKSQTSLDPRKYGKTISSHPGTVSANGNTMYLGKNIISNLRENGKEIVCRLSVEEKCFLDIFSVEKEEAKAIPTLREMVRDYKIFNCVNKETRTFLYRPSICGNAMYLPSKFFYTGRIKKGQRLGFTQTTDGKCYQVDVDPIMCELCGEMIQRRTENVKQLIVTAEEKEAAAIVRNTKQIDASAMNEPGTFQDASESIKQIAEILKMAQAMIKANKAEIKRIKLALDKNE